MTGIRRFWEGPWEWLEAEATRPAPCRGKHLFFSSRRDLLLKIARREIGAGGYRSSKISRDPVPGRRGYVLCLYGADGSGESALALRYSGWKGIRYAGWKGDACTLSDFHRKMCVNKGDLAIR